MVKIAAKTLLLNLLMAMALSVYAQTSDRDNQSNLIPSTATVKIDITVGDTTFAAYLYDNETTQSLIARFPMTVNMTELNGNEKYYHFPDSLPAETAKRPELINAGDIMLYSGYSLVLFYKTISTSYRYVRLGQVVDSSHLAAVLGPANVKVTFSLSE